MPGSSNFRATKTASMYENKHVINDVYYTLNIWFVWRETDNLQFRVTMKVSQLNEIVTQTRSIWIIIIKLLMT